MRKNGNKQERMQAENMNAQKSQRFTLKHFSLILFNEPMLPTNNQLFHGIFAKIFTYFSV